MADGATLDPAASTLTIGGIPIKGRAAGQSVQIRFRTDAFSLVVGVDGEGVYVKSGDQSAEVILSLMQSSDSNDVLSAFHLADRRTPGGVMLPFFYQDRGGRSVYTATGIRVMKLADGVWSDGHEVRQWTLITSYMEAFVGGLGKTPRYEGTLP